MKVQLSPQLLALTLVAGWTAACADAQKSGNQKKPAASTSEAGDSQDDDDDDPDAKASDDTDKVLSLFCERAAETKPVQDKLGDYLGKLCDGGKPTDVLRSKLVKAAYEGSGEPSLKKMEEWDEDKTAKTTAGYFGFGIKLPISIEDHFNKIGPKSGDEASFGKAAEASGSVLEIGKVVEEYEADGKYQVRGWKIEQRTTKEIPLVKIKATTHTISRIDQFELEKGKAYLYTQYVIEGLETVRAFDLVTAGVKLGDDSYLLTIAHVKIDNLGFHSVAMETLKTVASDLIKQMHKASDEAK